MRKVALGMGACLSLAHAGAQGLVPVITDLDRFVVFDRGRFQEVEPRKPLHIAVANDRIVYIDDQGWLKVYSSGNVTGVKGQQADSLIGSAGPVAFTEGSRLGLVRAAGSVMLSEDAGDVSVKDSLVCWHDRATGDLNVHWRNTVIPVARITKDAERPQWQLGRNTFTSFDHGARTLFLFYRGMLSHLCDSSDVGVVACGGDIVAFWDDGEQRFRVMDHGERRVLEEFRPIDFKAGDGVVAYNDVTSAFKVYRGGASIQVLDHMPTQYWVHDSTVVFVDRGMLWTVENGEAMVVEEYVPEQWAIHKGRIIYLDLNRELRQYHHGRWEELSHEARIPAFQVFGDAVLYRNEDRSVKVAWEGRVYQY